MCDPQFQARPLSAVGATQSSPDRKVWVTERREAIPLAPPHPRKHSVSTPRVATNRRVAHTSVPNVAHLFRGEAIHSLTRGSFRLVPFLCFAPSNFVPLASGRRLSLGLCLAFQSEILNLKFEILFAQISRLRPQLKPIPPFAPKAMRRVRHPQNPRLNSGMNCSSGISLKS
jgi:hypothetical protein